jgi:hypothetical protein
MPEQLAALIAFQQEHRRGGEMESSVEPDKVRMACSCGAERPIDEPSKDK